MDKRATCRKILRKTALSVLAASILMTGTVDAVRAEETPNVLQTVEAESGTLLGKAKIAATGTCVSGLEHTGDGVEVTVTVPEDGLYDIIVRTAVIGGGTKVNEVNANGQHVGDITNSGSWSDEVVPYVWLEAGDNTVSVTASYGWIAVDSFSIRRAAPLPADVYEVKPTLINPNATDSAKRLMTYLCDQYGKTVLSGQQSQDGAFGLTNAAVWRGTGGDYPAVLGMDLISYSPARVAKGDNSSNVVERAIEYWNGDEGKRGIVTLCWHWCPAARYDKSKNDPWGTFYTDKTKFNLARAMNGRDPDGYQMLLDDIDAIAVQLKRLQGLEREKLEAEYEELEKRIEYYRELLSNEEMLKGVLKDELIAIRDKYGDERRTEIQDVEDEIDIEDLIEEEQCVFTLSHAGYIKRVPASTYRAQKRGGRGVTGQSFKEEDFAESVFSASTHDYILFFTSHGKVHRKKGYQIPEAGRTAKGTNIVNILPLEPGETVTAGITVHEFDDDNLMFVTKQGTVKRVLLSSLNTARKAGIRALTLNDGDELISVMKTNGENNILLATRDGMAICFNEADVRVMGRDAAGVKGITLSDGDEVVGAGIAEPSKQLLTVTELGYGKRTELTEYMRLDETGERRPQQRGGKGLKNYNITAKTGRIAGVAIVDDEDDVMLIENGGVLIRMAAADINVYGRDTQGVILMRLESGSRLISVDRVDREPEEPAENEEA